MDEEIWRIVVEADYTVVKLFPHFGNGSRPDDKGREGAINPTGKHLRRQVWCKEMHWKEATFETVPEPCFFLQGDLMLLCFDSVAVPLMFMIL